MAKVAASNEDVNRSSELRLSFLNIVEIKQEGSYGKW